MNTAINGVSGIGPGTARVLMENGFKTLEDIAGSSIAQLAAIPGFGPARAGKVIKAASDFLSTNASSTSKADPASTRTRRIAQKPVRQPANTETKPEETVSKGVKEKVQEKLKKAEMAVEKQAKKAEKAAEGLAKKAKKAVEKKAKKVEKAAERLAKKAKKAAANLVKKAKKGKSKSKKGKKK